MKTVFGIGNPLIDIIAQVEDSDIESLGLDKGIMRLVDLDERAVILDRISSKEIIYRSGGSCPNTLVFLAALGVDCALAGTIASDEEGRAYRDHLPTNHLTSVIAIEPEGATGTSIILVTPEGERTMNTYLGVNRKFGIDDIDNSVLESAGSLYFTGYMWDTEAQKEAVLHAVSVIRSAGGRVFFDLADPFAVGRNVDEFRDLVTKSADVVFANADEARLLYDTGSADEAASVIAEKCDLVVVKDGAAGSVVKRAGEPAVYIPARRIQAVDTTGAGDMYAAGFIYGFLNQFSDRDAGLCGSYLASRIVETFGAQFTPEDRENVAAEVHAGKWRYA